MECLKNLNIDQKKAEKYGIHLLKIGMTWPLEAKKIEDFSRNMREVIVIEEKRAFLETNIKNILLMSFTAMSPQMIMGTKFHSNKCQLLEKNRVPLYWEEGAIIIILMMKEVCSMN